MRVPTIAWWLGHVPAGTSSDAICGMFDILPTFAALARAPLPKGRKLDGKDLTPVLTGAPLIVAPHDVFYYFNGLRLEGVREREWKLVVLQPATNKVAAANHKVARSLLLFNLQNDIGEKDDVAGENPEVVARLEKLLKDMDADLGTNGIGPGVRPLGRVRNPQPLIGYDGKVRPGFGDKRGSEHVP